MLYFAFRNIKHEFFKKLLSGNKEVSKENSSIKNYERPPLHEVLLDDFDPITGKGTMQPCN